MEEDWILLKTLPAHLICELYFIIMSSIKNLVLYSAAVMARCWYADPQDRPGFSELCSIMEQFLSLVSDYTELKMVLLEDNDSE